MALVNCKNKFFGINRATTCTWCATKRYLWMFSILLGFSSLNAQMNPKLSVEGLVTIDGNPAPANIEIYSALKNKGLVLSTNADKTWGVFRSELPLGDDYEIVIRVEAYPQQVLIINTAKIDTATYLNVFSDFVSPAYDKKIQELQQSITQKQNPIQKKYDPEVFAKKYGTVKKENLTYKIQVGAFKFVENFNYSNIVGLPKIIRKTDKDSVTRFTMGDFETYSEALSLLKLAQKHKLKQAFIVAYYKDDRKLVGQLVEEKIIQ